MAGKAHCACAAGGDPAAPAAGIYPRPVHAWLLSSAHTPRVPHRTPKTRLNVPHAKGTSGPGIHFQAKLKLKRYVTGLAWLSDVFGS